MLAKQHGLASSWEAKPEEAKEAQPNSPANTTAHPSSSSASGEVEIGFQAPGELQLNLGSLAGPSGYSI